MADFAATLKTFREKARVSQSKLADKAGIDHSFVSRMEAGSRMPTRETIDALALALQLDKSEAAILLISAGYLPFDIDLPRLFLPADLVELYEAYQDAPVTLKKEFRGSIPFFVRALRSVDTPA